MFNCLPGAMLKERHTHECKQGHSCGRALLNDTANSTAVTGYSIRVARRSGWPVTDRGYGSRGYRNEFLAKGFGLAPQAFDTLLLIALLICFRAFIDVGLSP